MDANYTDCGIECNHFRNTALGSIAYVGKDNISAVLWSNVLALMEAKWGGENINRLAREAKVGAATAMRVKDQDDVRISTVDKVAGAFGLKAWQILIPGLDPQNVPVTMISDDEKRLYAKLKAAQKAFQQE